MHLKDCFAPLLRIGGFGASTIATAVASLVSVPVLLSTIGAHQWGALSAGLSVGSIGAVFVGWGWGVVGPSQVAVAGDLKVGVYRASVAPRFLLAFPTLVLVTLVCRGTLGDFWFAAAIQSGSAVIYGLAAPWFFVGAGAPRDLFILDALPRALGVLFGAFATLIWPSASVFATVQLASVLISVLLTHIGIVGVTGISGSGLRRIVAVASWSGWLGSLNANASAVGTALVSSTYMALPVVLVAWWAPSLTAAFSLGDRLLKWTTMGLAPVAQMLQGWIPRVDEFPKRARRGIAVAVFIGGVSMLGFLVGGPWVSQVISHGELDLGRSACAAIGCTVLFTTVTRVSGPAVLAVLNRTSVMFLSSVVGAVFGLSLFYPALNLWGVPGALWCVALAELAVLVVQFVALWNRINE